MYKVYNAAISKEVATLAEALDYAKSVGEFVTIAGNGYEIVGIFGVDSIENGYTPSGIEYTWKKRRR